MLKITACYRFRSQFPVDGIKGSATCAGSFPLAHGLSIADRIWALQKLTSRRHARPLLSGSRLCGTATKTKGRARPPRRRVRRPPSLAGGPQRRCLDGTYGRSPGTGRVHNLGKSAGREKGFSFWRDTEVLYTDYALSPDIQIESSVRTFQIFPNNWTLSKMLVYSKHCWYHMLLSFTNSAYRIAYY